MDECTVTNYDVTLRLLYKCNPKTTTLKITYFLTPPLSQTVGMSECRLYVGTE
jgi:hypothetical protein